MWRVLAVVTWATACYAPVAASDVPCATNGDCPGLQVCDPRPAIPICVDSIGEGPVPDAPTVPVDGSALVDASILPPPDAAERTIPPGAALWLKLDDDPSDGVLDSAGSHPVTCTAACPTVVEGRIGSGYRFTAAEQLRTPDAPDLRPNTAFSIAVWVKLDALPSAEPFAAAVCKNLVTADASFCVSYRPTGRPTYYTAGNNLDGATAVTVGDWHHLATTWDGTTKRGYFDGTLDRSLLIAAITADAGSFVVGAALATPTLRFDGTIDEVVYYDRELSPAEVQQLASP